MDVKVKETGELAVRIPEWVSPEESRCRVNGKERPLSWRGRYAHVGEVHGGETVVMAFPISERTDRVAIEGREYTLVRKGNEVVDIDPPGQHCPLYQREKYRDDRVQRKQIERFVPNQVIEW